MFIGAYLEAASHIFESYTLQKPLYQFLKDFFRANKKFGSRDRKIISDLVYSVYRLGHENEIKSILEKLWAGAWLMKSFPAKYFSENYPLYFQQYELPLLDKLEVLKENGFIFNLPYALSHGLCEKDFFLNLFSRPKVFLRIRKNKQQIIDRLREHNVNFQVEHEHCISFSYQTNIEALLNAEDYVIQDMASQQTGAYFKPQFKERWWDCCAASGGKALLLLDQERNIHLTVSDVRSTILENLKSRLNIYGYRPAVLQVMDLMQPIPENFDSCFDAILADVPCSGSGTWARSPEQYYFFTPEKLDLFQTKQVKIVSNILSRLKPNGRLLYITCSILNYENEAVLNRLKQLHAVNIHEQKILNTFSKGGDAMFIAELSLNAQSL
ncbi:MAG: hypothetical protein JNJ58_06400 [Chitinophagaceae bacterium]|nr:hypothetical protein [Chitinophagaceae bacterium]